MMSVQQVKETLRSLGFTVGRAPSGHLKGAQGTVAMAMKAGDAGSLIGYLYSAGAPVCYRAGELQDWRLVITYTDLWDRAQTCPINIFSGDVYHKPKPPPEEPPDPANPPMPELGFMPRPLPKPAAKPTAKPKPNQQQVQHAPRSDRMTEAEFTDLLSHAIATLETGHGYQLALENKRIPLVPWPEPPSAGDP